MDHSLADVMPNL